MPDQATKPSRLAQVLRVALTFLLVFGLSFQTEIALAASIAAKAGSIEDYAGDELKDMTVFQLDADDATKLGPKVRSAVETAGKKNEDAAIAVASNDADGVELVAVPKWKAAGDGTDDVKVVADSSIAEWYVGDKKQQSQGGVFTITPAMFGNKTQVTVSCKLTAAASKLVSSSFEQGADNFAVTFKANLTDEPEPEAEPYSAEVSIACDDIKSGSVERLKGDDFPEYQFAATVKVFDENDEPMFTYPDDSGKDLATLSKGKIANPKWQLAEAGSEGGAVDPKLATIDESTGLLKVSDDCNVKVICTVTSPKGEVLDSMDISFTTSGKAKEYDQGSNKPQSELKFSGYVLSSDVSGKNEDESSSKASEQSESSAPETESKHFVDDYYSFEKEDPRTVDDIKGLSSYGQATYQMLSGKDKRIGVTGKGAALKDVLDGLVEGISDSKAIEQIKFIDADGGMVTYNWDELKALNPVIATDSVVHLPEELMGGSSGSSSAASGDAASSGDGEEVDIDKLLEQYGPYTRFRLLYNDAKGSVPDANGLVVDADRLRSIKEIVINPQIDPEERPEAPYSLTLEYTPVPVGKMVTLRALATGKLSEANFAWYESADGGKTWVLLNETSANYRFKMTEKMVGHVFKVTATSTDDSAIQASDQVTVRLPESNDDVVFDLVYHPPVAGDVAFFQVELANGEVDLKSVDYVWEFSEDKKNWTPLAEQYQHKPTLALQTQKVTESSNTPESPLSIRVRIVLKDESAHWSGKVAPPWPAGPVDFWVRNDEGKGDNPDKPSKPGNTDPKPSGGKENKNPSKSSDVSDSKNESYEPIDMSTVEIDDEVTEQIVEQEAAAQAEFESTVPGARWTTLSTKEASGNDDRNVFGANPFAPFAIPVSLGITVAGGLEKLLFFRRQL